MTFKKRIFLSNASIVVIPLAVTFIAVYIYWVIASSVNGTNFSIDDTLQYINIETRFIEYSDRLYDSNADQLLDSKTQMDLSWKLSEVNGKFVLIKDGRTIYKTIDIEPIDLESSIHAADNPAENQIVINKVKYRVKHFELFFSDGKNGKLLLYIPVDFNSRFYFATILIGGITFFVSFLITNAVVYFSISKNLIDPLSKLKNATSMIADGDLDFYIAENGDDEIRSLSRAFEQMRLKLKSSVEMQLKYEENRKMLITSISHDLKTPITSIKGYVEGLLDGVADTDEKRRKYLNTIHTKAILTDSLINDLLLHSKLDLNQVPLELQEINLVEFLKDMVQEYEFFNKNITFTFENKMDNKSNTVLGDIDKLSRVFSNIINNAVKYINNPEGKIDIILRSNKNRFIIEITDNGPGIKANELTEVFDHFYRGDASRKSDSGSGLGLAIAKQIVELHKGNIWIVSEAGKGTSVRMALPIYISDKSEDEQ